MITISDTIKEKNSNNHLKDYIELLQLVTRRLHVAHFHYKASVNKVKPCLMVNCKLSARNFRLLKIEIELGKKVLGEF